MLCASPVALLAERVGKARTSEQDVKSALPCMESSIKIGISSNVQRRSFAFWLRRFIGHFKARRRVAREPPSARLSMQ